MSTLFAVDRIVEALPTERERERYALLQAAAVLFAADHVTETIEESVTVARALLNEILKREVEAQQP